jgi:hypothetical protein
MENGNFIIRNVYISKEKIHDGAEIGVGKIFTKMQFTPDR